MKRFWQFIIPLLVVAAACSPYRYHTTRMQSVDFSQYRTYGWLPPVDSLSKAYYSNDIAKHNIMETVNDELGLRGLQYSKDEPDLLFRYIAIVNNKKRPIYDSRGWYGPWGYNPWMWHYGWGYGAWNRPVGEERYRAGHIILEARDRRTNTVIWQARGSGSVSNPERAINDLPEIVAGVMQEFPVTPPKTR